MTARVYQGEGKSILVTVSDSDIDLTTATEIEFTVDTNPQIKLTLSGSTITNVTTKSFTINLAASDTSSLEAGDYKFQARYTVSGDPEHLEFQPNKFRILESVLVNPSTGNDYS